MVDDLRARRLAALRGAGRVLSWPRPQTMREQLAELAGRDELDDWPDRYGDGLVTVLEERVAGLLGREAGVFFPTGTMAQQVALRYWAEETGSRVVAMPPLSHLEVHERRAYSTVAGLSAIWPTADPRPPTAAEVSETPEPFGTLLLELPLRDAGYLLPTWDELVSTVEAARGRGARVHFDGARLWESTPYLGHSLAEVAALADSVYVSFYKSLGALSGAVLTGSAALAAYARAWRHRYGGMIFQHWPAALSALSRLDSVLPELPGWVAHAQVVAAALATLPGARVYPDPPHTHQFQLWLDHSKDALEKAVLELAEEEKIWFIAGWRDGQIPGLSMAEVTVSAPALEWTADDVTDVAARFLARAARLTG